MLFPNKKIGGAFSVKTKNCRLLLLSEAVASCKMSDVSVPSSGAVGQVLTSFNDRTRLLLMRHNASDLCHYVPVSCQIISPPFFHRIHQGVW